jgi:hypothetical protein
MQDRMNDEQHHGKLAACGRVDERERSFDQMGRRYCISYPNVTAAGQSGLCGLLWLTTAFRGRGHVF